MGVIYIESDGTTKPSSCLRLCRPGGVRTQQCISALLVNLKNDELSKTYEELRKTYIDTVEALRLTVDAKDEYTRGHSDRVAYFACRVGAALGFPSTTRRRCGSAEFSTTSGKSAPRMRFSRKRKCSADRNMKSSNSTR